MGLSLDELKKRGATIPQQSFKVNPLISGGGLTYDELQNRIAPQEPGLIQRGISGAGDILGQAAANPIRTGVETVKGALKGLGSTLFGTAKLGQKIQENTLGKLGVNVPDIGQKPEFLNPSSSAQGLGFGLEQIAEFLAPAGLTAKAIKTTDAGILASKIAKDSPKIAKALQILARGGVGAAEMGGITAIQTGGNEEAVKSAAKLGFAIPVGLGIAGAVTKPIAKAVGEKIQKVVIKPTKPDIAAGFKIENVAKYDVGGNLPDMAVKTDSAIAQRVRAVKEIATKLSTQKYKPQVNLYKELNEAEKSFAGGTGTFGVNKATFNAFQKLREELDLLAERGVIPKNGSVDFDKALEIKRATGNLGAWQFGKFDPDANALEKAADVFYNRLKVALEGAAKNTEFAKLNKELSELIPIESALIRRAPVAERNNVIGLMDAVTAIPGLTGHGIWPFVLQRILRSGGVGNKLTRFAMEPEQRGVIGTSLFGAGSAQKLTQGEQNVASKITDYLDNPKLGMSIEDVSQFKGFKDLTTKVLSKLEGRSTVSKQFISDLTNSPDLKQAERDLIREVLKGEGDKVSVTDFANKVKTELLPLKIDKKSPFYKAINYENITLPDELRGPIANYEERIYQSPIKTSAGNVHYTGHDVPNYFAHTRIEDLPKIKSGEPFDNTIGATPSGNYQKGDTRRVIEIQSDLFQKGRLENEQIAKNMYLDDASYLAKDENGRGYQRPIAERQAELAKLEPYRNTWHERVIREEVKQAAKDGKTKLQFPTGETAMKIEGLGDRNNWLGFDNQGRYRDATPDNIKVGDVVGRQRNPNDEWVITDILADGRFSAVPKDLFEGQAKSKQPASSLEQWKETFDISGKVDESNPIFKFYEKEVGKYLKNKYNAQLITDPQGVRWWQIDIKKDYAKTPVEAFGIAPLGLLGLEPSTKEKE